MPRTYRIVTLLVLMSACWLSGCDNDPNTAWTTRDQFVQGVDTVYVPMWNRNRDIFRRELEFRITEAVAKEIQASTPYRISSESRADTMLTGEIVEIPEQVMNFNPDSGNPREKEIIMTIAFRWVDLRTGKELAKEDAIEVTATYIPDFGEDYFQGSEAAFNAAARRVVQSMHAEW